MTATPVPYFFYAFGILLREGLEAMLVVVALAAGVKQMGQGRRVREIYTGAMLAIVASILLAWGADRLISDDANDTMEGIFQLVAAGTLFYVSSWLTAKTQADRWREFLFSNLKEAGRQALPFAMGVTAFLAVLREGAETIVFFQALLAGASKGVEHHAIWAGMGGGGRLADSFLHLGEIPGSHSAGVLLPRHLGVAVCAGDSFRWPGDRQPAGSQRDQGDLRSLMCRPSRRWGFSRRFRPWERRCCSLCSRRARSWPRDGRTAGRTGPQPRAK